MRIDQIGDKTPIYERLNRPDTNSHEPSATAADFAELIKKLAGPEMLWKEQPAEMLAAEGGRDYAGAMGNLMTVRENKK